MAKPNYQFEKRQRDLAKKSKQEEKRRQKLAAKAADDGGHSAAENPSESTAAETIDAPVADADGDTKPGA